MNHSRSDIPMLPSGLPAWDDEDEPHRVYHYTNLRGLKGIIEKQNLWASDVWYMNDTGEATYSLEELRKFIAFCEPEIGEMKNIREGAKEIVDDWRRFIVDDWRHKVNRQNYIACLSEKRNELSQWRAYGPISIGFDFEALRRLFSPSDSSCEMTKVIYDKPKQQGILHDAFRQAGVVLAHYRDDSGARSRITDGSTPLEMAIAEFISHFIRISASFKHCAFREEKEVRISTTRAFDDGKPPSDIEFCESALGITPHVDISLRFPGEARMSVIQEVMIGPQSHQQEIRRAVGQFLAKEGFASVDVVASEIPLRT